MSETILVFEHQNFLCSLLKNGDSYHLVVLNDQDSTVSPMPDLASGVAAFDAVVEEHTVQRSQQEIPNQ